MPRILNGTEHVAVCTCGEDFCVLVTEILLRRLLIKQINNIGFYVVCVCKEAI